MANFRRRRPRTRTSGKRYDKWEARRLEKKYGDFMKWGWLSRWPAWWDIEFHRRPHRRATSDLLSKVMRDYVDPDEVAWPLSKKPHKYFW